MPILDPSLAFTFLISFEKLESKFNKRFLPYFLNIAANYKVPKDRLKLILDSVELMSPAKYNSSKIINNRCKELIRQIISDLD